MSKGKREAEQRCGKNKEIGSLLSGFLSSVSKSLTIRLTESTSSRAETKYVALFFANLPNWNTNRVFGNQSEDASTRTCQNKA